MLLACLILQVDVSRLDGARQGPVSTAPTSDLILSIVGTNDLHGRVFPSRGRGGLALLAGFVNNLRAAREADRGAVILLDAGDTFQGGIDSNLSQGAIVVDAYNALGYTAAAIGNHEFDFGPVDGSRHTAVAPPDPRGALKALAAHAAYPFLAANLLDAASGRPVDWPNVRPSTLVEAAGITVGIVGVMTTEALRATLSVNVGGLRMAPLVETIEVEARKLRERGATVIIVAAHAGGRCTRFESPTDLSSCDASSEIFGVARRLPDGLVDAIVAGHTHAGLAHQVSGIAIVEGLSLGLAFSRVDLRVDRHTLRVTGAQPFAPQEICAFQAADTGACAADDEATALVPARYEQRLVGPDPAIVRAMEPALERVRARQAVGLDVVLNTPIGREGDLESPLGNLFARAMHEATPGADVAISSNKVAGLRADLAAGPLTFGRLYDVFPFDDRLVRLSVAGAQLRSIFAADVRRERRGALGVSGVSIRATCSPEGLRIDLTRPSGAPIGDADRVTLVTTDLLARGPLFAALAAEERFDVPASALLAREVVAGWLRQRGGPLSAGDFIDPSMPHWHPFDTRVSRCEATGAESR
jgi:5'-nucleotidase